MRLGISIGLANPQHESLSDSIDYFHILDALGVDGVLVRAAFDLFATEVIPCLGTIPVAGR